MDVFFHFTYHFLMIFMAYTTSTNGEMYYIKPSQNFTCLQQSCLTLSELAASSSTNASIFFLPGNHYLDRELVLRNANNISLTKMVESAFITCRSQSARVDISHTDTVLISGLHFMGCGGNTVTHVNQLTLANTIFEGMEGSSTALLLSGIASVDISSLALTLII